MNELRGHAANERQMQAKVAKCNQNEIEIAGARTPDGRSRGAATEWQPIWLGTDAFGRWGGGVFNVDKTHSAR